MKSAHTEYLHTRQAHRDKVAQDFEHWRGWGGYYQKRIADVFAYNIPPNKKILEIGCGSGDLIASLKPAYGLGIDLSVKMILRAKQLHPDFDFLHGEIENLDIHESFDFIILSDMINDLWDVQSTLKVLCNFLEPDGRIILNFYSRVWEIPLRIASRLRLAKPTLVQNWLTREDTENLLVLSGFDVVRNWVEILMPLPIPLIHQLSNKFLVRLWPFNLLAMANFIVARKKPEKNKLNNNAPGVSVIIPARNEEGNIAKIFERTPKMGKKTELIFIEGHSSDNTFFEIEKQIKENFSRNAKLFQQTGSGKGDAVRLGFSKASGDILMILDADLTMPPEYLPRYYDAIVNGIGDFINGVRLVYPMQRQAMRFINLLGNKAFSLIFTFLIGQPIKDTLCGTKVLWRKDYIKISQNRDYFGEFDPFGDFDLIFGAAKLNLKMIDMPIRYMERSYGTTNIQRWKHSWLLVKMIIFGAKRLKFV